MQKKLHFLLALMLFFTTSIMAQVTTSSINGKVVVGNENVIGATVTAVHVPSGTTYNAVTNVDGRYTIQGMRVGGPYTFEVMAAGYLNPDLKNITDWRDYSRLLSIIRNAILSRSAGRFKKIYITDTR